MLSCHDFLQINVRKKRVHDHRVSNFVMALTSGSVSSDFLQIALSFFCQAELNDAMECRYNDDHCGYFQCENKIMVNSTLLISLDVSKKKIYSVENRKKFCSDWCYAAFLYARKQLPPTPTWTKTSREIQVFSLYAPEEPGCKGEVMFDESENKKEHQPEDCRRKLEKTVLADNTNKLVNRPDEDAHEQKLNRIQNVIVALDNMVTKPKRDLADLQLVVEKVKQSQVEKQDKKCIRIDEFIGIPNIMMKLPTPEALKNVVNSVSNWISDETIEFIESSEPDAVTKYMERDGTEDYSFIPPLDDTNQAIIRKSIVLNRLRTCGLGVLSELKINESNFFVILNQFLDTCELTSTNILFTVTELRWLTIVLSQLLQLKINGPVVPAAEGGVFLEQVLRTEGMIDLVQFSSTIEPLLQLISPEPVLLVSSQGDNST